MVRQVSIDGSQAVARGAKQDLHIHTTFSSGDSAIVNEQTVELVAQIAHAEILGISDHLDFIHDCFTVYEDAVRSQGLYVGTEVNGAFWVAQATQIDVEYYIYHCLDEDKEYKGVEKLLETGKPVIIAHPLALGTNLSRIPSECLIEINNRYVWRSDWQEKLIKYRDRFRWVLSSDAHQPNWLNQHVACYVAECLGIEETLVFDQSTK